MGYRLRLDFNTSFTGEDRLRRRLQATNLRLLDIGTLFGGSQGTRAGEDPAVTEPIDFGVTGETRFTPSSVTQSSELGDRYLLYWNKQIKLTPKSVTSADQVGYKDEVIISRIVNN